MLVGRQLFDVHGLLAELKACSTTRDLQRGKDAHAAAVECGHDSNIYVANSLITMYARCGSMSRAQQVFDGLELPSVVSCNALILGYAENGQAQTALALFRNMRKTAALAPDSVTFLAVLKAGTSLEMNSRSSALSKCRNIHNMAVEIGCGSDIRLQNALIDMYGKCGCMVWARRTFEAMKHPSVVSWTVLILGYADNGEAYTALYLFRRMKTEGFLPSTITFFAAMRACSTLAQDRQNHCEDLAKRIHNLVVENAYDLETNLQNTLVNMYARCGRMVDARQVFDNMEHPNTVSWTVLMLGYVENGESSLALNLFSRIKAEPDSVMLAIALKGCTSLVAEECRMEECRDRGKKIHNLAVETGCESDIYLQNTLLDMYTKSCGMADARQVFDSMRQRSVASWAALILGYAENGQALTGLDMFMRMRSTGPAPDAITFLAALKACSLVGALEIGRSIHLEADGRNVHSVNLVNCLVDFYAKCDSLLEAKLVFDLHAEARDVVTWNALLSGFSNCGHHEYVFGLFEGMQDAGLRPNAVTLLCVLTCCSHAGLLKKARECFDAMPAKYGVDPCIKHYNCMLDLFGRTNKLNDAMALLQSMPHAQTDVTWTTILGACCKWRNVDIGRLAFQSLMKLNASDAAGYVLMGQIYASRGMLQEQEAVMKMVTETSASN